MQYNRVQTGFSAEVVWDVQYSEKVQEPVNIHNAFKPFNILLYSDFLACPVRVLSLPARLCNLLAVALT